ncbi:MAG: type II toxin-antitoxin system RelE/ParE family toxin [Candidatus Desulfofervidaceae bacterium]|nr:type II toxin-antitoxin system RelE/ParE family toxin [Candidatus Desulfofervidaceae bacterium]
MWKVKYTKRFLKELSKVPKNIQERVEKIVFMELKESNPFSLGYVERLKGFKDKYKIRVGDYRIGLRIDKEKKEVVCLRVARRKDIYKLFP